MSMRSQFVRAVVLVAAFCCGAALASAQSSSGSGSGGGSAPNATTPQSQTGNNGTPSDKPAQAPSSKDKSAKEDAVLPDDPSMTKIRLRVTNNQDKPVPNASVYIRYNESGGLFHKDHLSEMNFKTNDDGSVKVPEVPIGKVLIQIVAKGYHTYGKWYDIAKDPDEIAIKLDPPPHWY
jgi:Carboxypeptidase regulatory-like domain